MTDTASNLEIVRAAVRTLNDERRPATEFFATDAEWYAPPEWLERRVYRGHDQIAELADLWLANFDDYRWDLETTTDLDSDRVLVLIMHRGTAGGASVEQPLGMIFELAGSKVIRIDTWFSWEEAQRAAAA